jgi:hypothetical protein
MAFVSEKIRENNSFGQSVRTLVRNIQIHLAEYIQHTVIKKKKQGRTSDRTVIAKEPSAEQSVVHANQLWS